MKKILTVLSFLVLSSCGKTNSDGANPTDDGATAWTNTWFFSDGNPEHKLVISTSRVLGQDFDMAATLLNFSLQTACKASSNSLLTCSLFGPPDTLTKNNSNHSVTLTLGFGPAHTYTFYAADHLIADNIVGTWKTTDGSQCSLLFSKLNDTQYQVLETTQHSSAMGTVNIASQSEDTTVLTADTFSILPANLSYVFSSSAHVINVQNDVAHCGNEQFSR